MNQIEIEIDGMDRRGYDFSNSDFPNPNLKKLEESEQVSNQLISQEKISENFIKDFMNADLRGASFRGATIYGFDFSGAKLHGADFAQASLIRVKFDQVKTGLTNRLTLILRLICFPITSLAGIICGYSSGLFCKILIPDFQKLLEISEFSKRASEAALKFGLGALISLWFLLSLFFIFSEGIRSKFLISGVIFIATSLAIIAINEGELLPITSFLGHAAFTGGFVGILVQTQSSYLNRALDIHRNQDMDSRLKLSGYRRFVNSKFFTDSRKLLLLFFSFYFAWRGADLGGKHVKIAFWVAIIMLFLGDRLSSLAANGSPKVRDRHSSIRQFFDGIISNFQTNFNHASLSGVTFEGAKIRNTSFVETNYSYQDIGQIFKGSDKEVENVSVLVNKGSSIEKSAIFNAQRDIYIINSQFASKIEQNRQNDDDAKGN